eukprot:TRINITY_DN90376_c0_g1_i1.p1 TRINITY_DN90376_c0_g1~~TRINITY_DN90376_c0_g1_i1.p1  ORF type:complete len:480 (-),score=15.29 TRINITY_DN90376_c0_g1_i1:9-1448(-)
MMAVNPLELCSPHSEPITRTCPICGGQYCRFCLKNHIQTHSLCYQGHTEHNDAVYMGTIKEIMGEITLNGFTADTQIIEGLLKGPPGSQLKEFATVLVRHMYRYLNQYCESLYKEYASRAEKCVTLAYRPEIQNSFKLYQYVYTVLIGNIKDIKANQVDNFIYTLLARISEQLSRLDNAGTPLAQARIAGNLQFLFTNATKYYKIFIKLLEASSKPEIFSYNGMAYCKSIAASGSSIRTIKSTMDATLFSAFELYEVSDFRELLKASVLNKRSLEIYAAIYGSSCKQPKDVNIKEIVEKAVDDLWDSRRIYYGPLVSCEEKSEFGIASYDGYIFMNKQMKDVMLGLCKEIHYANVIVTIGHELAHLLRADGSPAKRLSDKTTKDIVLIQCGIKKISTLGPTEDAGGFGCNSVEIETNTEAEIFLRRTTGTKRRIRYLGLKVQWSGLIVTCRARENVRSTSFLSSLIATRPMALKTRYQV